MTTTTTNATAKAVENSVNANATVGSKSTTAAAKTQRVLETRQAWDVVFNHMAGLVASLAKGESLCENPRDGFAFGKVADQPHIRGYAQGLLAGFVSRKANKFLGEVDGLKTIEDRTKIALAILTATKLGGKTTETAKVQLSKAEPKQAKTFSEAVLNLVQNRTAEEVAPTEQVAEETAVSPKGENPTEVAAPTEQKPKRRSSSPKGKKAAEDGSKPKRGGKRGSTKAAAMA
ncbi:MAG: hypothetical protein IKW44_03995 [Bacteroidaceae bacterium]|nr:hypothetical protein [Bacteroidaceae bacterium]